MGISFSEIQEEPVANQVIKYVEATFDASYTAGGEPVTASDVRLGRINTVSISSGLSAGGYSPRWDAAAGTLMMYQDGGAGAPSAEVAGGTDLTGETVRLTVRGRS